MPGYVNYFYKDGVTAANTKTFFTDQKILTVQSVIVKNALLFMYKVHKFPQQLPFSMRATIPKNAPTAGSNYETCTEWLSENCYAKSRNSIYFKGPLLFTELAETYEIWNSCNNTISLKNSIKRTLLEIQGRGDPTEWLSENFKLYNIHGLRQSKRIANSSL